MVVVVDAGHKSGQHHQHHHHHHHDGSSNKTCPNITSPDDWVALDDGSEVRGASMSYENRITHDRKRQRPQGLTDKYWEDGTRAYVFLGRCTQCRDEISGPEVHSLNEGSQVVAFNCCAACCRDIAAVIINSRQRRSIPLQQQQQATEPNNASSTDTTRTWEVVYGSPSPPPKCLYLDLIDAFEDPDRETHVHDRALAAKQWVAHQVAAKRQRALKSWIASRAGRDYNYYKGEYMVYDQGHDKMAVYFGELEGTRPHGIGFMILPDGSDYFGPFMNGLRVGGQGTFRWRDGRQYFGDWFSDKMHGNGKLTYPDGSVHEGVYMLGRQHGPGTLHLPDGTQLKGRWRNGARDGEFLSISSGHQKEVKDFTGELPPPEREDDPVNTKVRFKVFEGLDGAPAAAATEEVDPEVQLQSPPSLLLKCQLLVGSSLSKDLSYVHPELIGHKVPRHLRARIAQELLESANEASTAFREMSGDMAWQPVGSADFSGRYLKELDLHLMSHFLGGAFRSLLSLKLVGNHINADGIMIVAAILPRLVLLADLNLSYNPLGKDGADVLSRAIQAHPSLRSLGLAGCKLGAKGTQAVCSMVLCAPQAGLTKLDLAFNDMGPDGAAFAANALTKNRSLTHLNLRFNRLGPKGGALISDALPHNDRCLKLLLIADNHIGDNVATMLASRNRAGAKNVLQGFCYRGPGALPVTVPALMDDDEEGKHVMERK